jgi:uncharacterized protein (TIGR04255 family)
VSANQPPSIVDFHAPPVVEVVCGVQFEPLAAMRAAHLGLYWQRVRDTFPDARDAPPLPAVLEQVGPGANVAAIQAAFGMIAPVPRALFVDRNGKELLQVQNGRFHHNWQRLHGGDQYQRYAAIRPAFAKTWGAFSQFVSEEQLGALRPIQYEMSYVNHVPEGELWDEVRGLGGLFPWFAPRNSVVGHSFEPEFALHSPYPACRGRLHVTGRIGVRPSDEVRVFVLELVVRGAPHGADDADLITWMDEARACIVRSFVELTSGTARQHWGQKT